MMAETAKYRDDISGAIVTTGTSTAYGITSNSIYDSVVHLDKQMIAFTPHVTNAVGGVTLSVDSLTPKPLRSAPGVELLAGTIIQGTPYVATYNNTDGAFYLQSFFGASPYLIPLGVSLDFWGATAPNSSFAFPFGQAISRTTYTALFSLFGSSYGNGDGSTTFNIPDLRGRVTAGVDNMGGSAAGRLTSASGMGTGQIGQTGGAEKETLLTANLPPYTPTGAVANGAITFGGAGAANSFANNANSAGGGGNAGTLNGLITASQGTSTFTGTAQGGTSTPVITLPPIMVCNRILRII